MPVVSLSFDLATVQWRQVCEPDTAGINVDFAYSLLGYDLDTGRLDMLLRFGRHGHCRRHRHIASTVTLVLEGEQYLEEYLQDGSTRLVHRKKGDYALAEGDALPHDEYGGDHGGTVLLSMSAKDGILFEYFDETMKNSWTVSIEEYVDSWNKGTVHGMRPGG